MGLSPAIHLSEQPAHRAAAPLLRLSNRIGEDRCDREQPDLAAAENTLGLVDGVSADDELQSVALPDPLDRGAGEDQMIRNRVDRHGAPTLQGVNTLDECAGRIDHVVDDDAGHARDLADDLHHLGLARCRATLVDDGQTHAKLVGVDADAFHAACVRADDDNLLAFERGDDPRQEDRRRVQVIEWNRTTGLPFDLRRMHLHGHEAVRTRSLQHLNHAASRNGVALPAPTVLARVSEIGHDNADTAAVRALGRVDEQRELHEVVCLGMGQRLDDDDVLAAHGLEDFDVLLAVRELGRGQLDQWDAQLLGDLLGEPTVRPSCQQTEVRPCFPRFPFFGQPASSVVNAKTPLRVP